MSDAPDYSRYSLEQLLDARSHIDVRAFPERTRQLDELIALRESSSMRITQTTVPQVLGRSTPKGRGLSSNRIVAIVGGSVLLFAILCAIGVWAIFALLGRSEFGRGADSMFGDQHLKTVVALVELHKVRSGEYPSSLDDLRFTGQWDQIHIQAVSYCTSEDRSSYFVTVERGWIGKPSLTMEDEFWAGTGYDSTLGPCL